MDQLREKRLDYFKSRTNSKPIVKDEAGDVGLPENHVNKYSVSLPEPEEEGSLMQSELEDIDIEQTEFENDRDEELDSGLELFQLLRGSEMGTISAASNQTADQLTSIDKVDLVPAEDEDIIKTTKDRTLYGKSNHFEVSSEEEIELFETNTQLDVSTEVVDRDPDENKGIDEASRNRTLHSNSYLIEESSEEEIEVYDSKAKLDISTDIVDPDPGENKDINKATNPTTLYSYSYQTEESSEEEIELFDSKALLDTSINTMDEDPGDKDINETAKDSTLYSTSYHKRESSGEKIERFDIKPQLDINTKHLVLGPGENTDIKEITKDNTSYIKSYNNDDSSEEEIERFDIKPQLDISTKNLVLGLGENTDIKVITKDNTSYVKSYNNDFSSVEEIGRFGTAWDKEEVQRRHSGEDLQAIDSEKPDHEELDSETNFSSSTQEFEMLEEMLKSGIDPSLDENDGIRTQLEYQEISIFDYRNPDEKFSHCDQDNNNNIFTNPSSHLSLKKTEMANIFAPEGHTEGKKQEEKDDLLDLVGLSDSESTVSSSGSNESGRHSSSETFDEDALDADYTKKLPSAPSPGTKVYPPAPSLPSSVSSALVHSTIFVSIL